MLHQEIQTFMFFFTAHYLSMYIGNCIYHLYIAIICAYMHFFHFEINQTNFEDLNTTKSEKVHTHLTE